MKENDPIELDYQPPRDDPDQQKSNPIISATVGILLALGFIVAWSPPPFLRSLMMPQRQNGPTKPQSDIASIMTALQKFEIENNRLPTTQEGIGALITNPNPALLPNWSKCLDVTAIPRDPWNHPYIYRFPSTRQGHDFDLISMGPDGILGTQDDITPQ